MEALHTKERALTRQPAGGAWHRLLAGGKKYKANAFAQ
jgi:hypothetical protein